jgi:hypothetical protein
LSNQLFTKLEKIFKNQNNLEIFFCTLEAEFVPEAYIDVESLAVSQGLELGAFLVGVPSGAKKAQNAYMGP